ncbi:hypothetical protein [Arthrobacter cheniae]|uniref:hypothetical protein n=1 Tax=Arthrobacter cheniae TaxID=1258888 RepID=UPI0011C3A77A|nr:hypothetical protein [Arthrobacter cheniae]
MTTYSCCFVADQTHDHDVCHDRTVCHDLAVCHDLGGDDRPNQVALPDGGSVPAQCRRATTTVQSWLAGAHCKHLIVTGKR